MQPIPLAGSVPLLSSVLFCSLTHCAVEGTERVVPGYSPVVRYSLPVQNYHRNRGVFERGSCLFCSPGSTVVLDECC